MNALARFVRLGADDADRRVAAALAPRDHEAAERYLLSSASLRMVDRAAARLESWWIDSATGRALRTLGEAWSRESRSSHLQAIGSMLLVAVATHLALMAWQGPPPGLFWLLIPAMAAAAGAWLVAAARSADLPT